MAEGFRVLDGNIMWTDGCNQGAEGFVFATAPTPETLIYDPSKPVGVFLQTGVSFVIAGLCHSVALLLLHGTVIVTGSNDFCGVTFTTSYLKGFACVLAALNSRLPVLLQMETRLTLGSMLRVAIRQFL